MSYLFGMFIFCAALGIPIAFAFGITAALYFYFFGPFPPFTVVQRMTIATESWPLLAIPFFMIMGEAFMRGGMGRRILNLISGLVGRVSGGLASVCVGANMFMAGISGAAVADAMAIGSVLIPEMKRKGYPTDFIVALHSSSAVIGIIIPPSIPIIIYAWLTDTSVRDLFIAGIVPGLLVGLTLIAITIFISRREGYPKEDWVGWRGFLAQLLPNSFAFLTPVIVIGGIIGGIVTTTEAAVIGCLYVFLVEALVYRELSWKDLGPIFINAGKMTGACMLILAAASAIAMILAVLQVPQTVSGWIGQNIAFPTLILLAMLLWFLIQGLFLDLLPGLILATPIFFPLAVQAGLDPIQFGIVMTMALGIGLFTPPVGVVLYAVTILAGTSIERVSVRIIPFMLGMIAILLLVTFVPVLTLGLIR